MKIIPQTEILAASNFGLSLTLKWQNFSWTNSLGSGFNSKVGMPNSNKPALGAICPIQYRNMRLSSYARWEPYPPSCWHLFSGPLFFLCLPLSPSPFPHFQKNFAKLALFHSPSEWNNFCNLKSRRKKKKEMKFCFQASLLRRILSIIRSV